MCSLLAAGRKPCRATGADAGRARFFSTPERWEQLQRALGSEQMLLDHDGAVQGSDPLDPDRKFGTVGAVALDLQGNLAAAASTGGMTNKQAGRVGDSPLAGAGCYANNATVAVSCTGTGEVFIRTLAAYDVSAQMEYGGRSLQQATASVIHDKVQELEGSGGLIAVDAHVALPFNSEACTADSLMWAARLRWRFTATAGSSMTDLQQQFAPQQVLAVRDLCVRFEHEGRVTDAVRQLSLDLHRGKRWRWWANRLKSVTSLALMRPQLAARSAVKSCCGGVTARCWM